ncbi:TPA: hypothetical protein ACW7X5_001820 [Elizabethkingia meningoseptica]
MNTLEKKQIQKYLEDKRLPLDLYTEIEDHIISQIEELENNGIGFQEAFLQVQSKWKRELSFQNFNFNDLSAVPNIVGKIRYAYIKKSIPVIILLSVISSAILLLGAYRMDLESFKSYFLVVFFVLMSLPAILYVFNFKIFIQRLGYKKQKLNVFQQMVDTSFAIYIMPLMMGINNSMYATSCYKAAHLIGSNWINMFISLSFPLYFSSISLYAAFVFIKYKKEVAKMRLA